MRRQGNGAPGIVAESGIRHRQLGRERCGNDEPDQPEAPHFLPSNPSSQPSLYLSEYIVWERSTRPR
jgi:hypothetical protein